MINLFNLFNKSNDYTLYVGLNDKDSHVQEVATDMAYSIVADVVGDNTITEATGTFTHEDGTRVVEKTFKVEVFGLEKQVVDNMCNTLKSKLNQESIAVAPKGKATYFV